MSHSPEPWRVETKEQGTLTPDVVIHHDGSMMKGYPVAHLDGTACCHAIEDAERIVACVNACKGIPTKALDAGVIHEFIWNRLLGISWDTCKPCSPIVLPEDDHVCEPAAFFKEHGGAWEQYT